MSAVAIRLAYSAHVLRSMSESFEPVSFRRFVSTVGHLRAPT